MSGRVHVSMATVPDREQSLFLVVDSLIDQVDSLHIYLNGHEKVPDLPISSKIVISDSKYHGDKGAAGKFFWADKLEGYLFTCDDDIVYPSNYVEQTIAGIEQYERKAVVGYHGSIFKEKFNSYAHDRICTSFADRQSRNLPVHILGTGVMAYHFSTLPDFSIQELPYPNMTDIWFGVFCKERKVPMVSLSRSQDWFMILPQKESIWAKVQKNDYLETKCVCQNWPWEIHEP